MKRVTVIGSGYVGTVVAACLAHHGHRVIGLEKDRAKLDSLRAGRVPFYEPGLEDILRPALDRGELTFTDDYPSAMDASDIVFICVGTPLGEDGHPKMDAMIAVAAEVAANLRHHHVLVNKSTVPIGSGRWLASMIEEVAPDRAVVEGRFSVVSNPEFLREGCAVSDYLNPDRVVIGSDDPHALDEVAELYESVLASGDERVPLVRTDLSTAEMTKYASNAFLATKISFANEIAHLCELVGADVTEVTAGMGLDTRIGAKFLDAGLGWGGSCFGKDVAALVSTGEEYGYTARLLNATVDVNTDQRHLVVEHLLRDLKWLRGARVAVLGMAFKPGTDDLRDSPAVDVIRRLVHRGCFVTAYDPVVKEVPGLKGCRIAESALDAAWRADAVVVATDWPEFLTLDLTALRSTMRGDLLIDGRNVFAPDLAESAGFRYRGVGRGTTSFWGSRTEPKAGVPWVTTEPQD